MERREVEAMVRGDTEVTVREYLYVTKIYEKQKQEQTYT
jgi:hypothetical protein